MAKSNARNEQAQLATPAAAASERKKPCTQHTAHTVCMLKAFRIDMDCFGLAWLGLTHWLAGLTGLTG